MRDALIGVWGPMLGVVALVALIVGAARLVSDLEGP